MLHLENLLYLALVLNFVFYLAFSMCRIAKKLLYLALMLHYVFHLALPINCTAKYILFLALVLNCFFYLALSIRCAELQKTLMFDVVVDAPLLFGTCDKLHCKISYIWRLCSTTSFIWHCQCAACWKPLIFRACVELRLLLALSISSIAKCFLHLTLVLNFF